MKHLILSFIIFPVALSMLFAEAPGPQSFLTLGEAVTFIESCILANDQAALFGACANLTISEKEYQAFLFNQLAARNSEIPFRQRYLGKAFPQSGDVFKLGGHFMELGCIHIDFTKSGDRWYLSDIWMCR